LITLKNICIQINNRTLLNNEEITLYNGNIHVIEGESGCGKTTLLHEISLLSHLSNSVFEWNDQRIDHLDDTEKAKIRRMRIGYILQDLELVSENLSLRDNIKCMVALTGQNYDETLVQKYMNDLNLSLSLEQPVESLSRGERQRFALLLALIKDVELIVCDEPTSALDIKNAKELMEYLRTIAKKYHKIILIASHDYLVSNSADIVYKIENQQLILKKDNFLLEESLDSSHDKQISNEFYKIYNKSSQRITKSISRIIYVVMIVVLTIAPLIINSLLSKQQALYDLYANNEIIVVNTESRLPLCTFNSTSQLFTEAQLNLLNEIDHVENLDYYWEMNGEIIKDGKSIDVLVLPKNNIENIVLPSSIDGNMDNAQLKLSLTLASCDYEFETKIQTYDIKDYPTRTNTDMEVIYMPLSMMKEILNTQHIDKSSSICVSVDDIANTESTVKNIKEWFLNATVYTAGNEYVDQLKFLKVIQQYMTILRTILVIGIIAVTYIIQTMENKSREKEIIHLRINGLNKKTFYKLYIYENKNLFIITIICCFISYIMGIIFFDLPISLSNVIMIILQLMLYIVLTKILPIYVSLENIFKKDISSVLRDY